MTLSLVEEINFGAAMNKEIFFPAGSIPKGNPMAKMKKFVDYIEASLNKSIELFDIFNEDGTVSDIADGSKSTSTIDIRKDKEHMAAVNFLQSLMNFFSFYMMKADQPMNQETLRLLTYVTLVASFCSLEKFFILNRVVAGF